MVEITTGSVVEGKITGIKNFGAFVDLGEGKVGLVHISQIAHAYVTDINKHVKIGDSVKVKVLGVNKDGKFDLSIKKAQEPPPIAPRSDQSMRMRDRPEPGSFEDMMSRFLKQSEEKLHDLKKNTQMKYEGKPRGRIKKKA